MNRHFTVLVVGEDPGLSHMASTFGLRPIVVSHPQEAIAKRQDLSPSLVLFNLPGGTVEPRLFRALSKERTPVLVLADPPASSGKVILKNGRNRQVYVLIRPVRDDDLQAAVCTLLDTVGKGGASVDGSRLDPRERGKGAAKAGPTARKGPTSPPWSQATAAGERTRVVIVAGERLFRDGLRLILSAEDGIEVLGDAAEPLEAVKLVSDLKPDVVLIELAACESGEMEVIRTIKAQSPATKPLILTATGDEALIFKALKAGVKGCVSKDASRADLVKAIQAVHRGEAWVGRKLIAGFLEMEEEGSARFIRRDDPSRTKEMLTPREHDVVRVLASGGTNKDIAHALDIGEKTVKSHLNNIFRKLNVARRLEVALYAIREGLR